MESLIVTFCTVAMLMLQPSVSYLRHYVDLSSRNLSSVPGDLPKEVEFIDLSRNHIQVLQRGDFRNTPILRFLNISWNCLEGIHPETFLGTPLLEDLDLSHNHLKNLTAQRYLQHAGNLVVLNLAYNRFLTMTLAREFSSLVKLERLTLGGNIISVGDFRNIAAVKLRLLSLHLEGKLLYDPGTLKDVYARRLQVKFNKEFPHHLINDALSFFAEVELLKLSEGYQELSKQLSQRAEIYTSHLYLTDVSINWPDFTQYVNVALNTTISHLSLSGVTLHRLPQRETPVAKSSQVKSVTVRKAVVTSFLFSQEAVYNFFINMPVESLALTETAIIHMTCPKSQSPITHLSFSHCSLTDTIFSRVEGLITIECKTLGNLRTLTLAGNNFKSLKSLSERMRYMKSLQDVDLSLNLLEYDGQGECVWPPNISRLSLFSNSLTSSAFQCLPMGVERLDLQNNQISAVSSSILTLKRLLSLNLNANRLLDLPVCDNFPLLQELLLRSNSLHAPSVDRLKSCPKLKTLDVSGNAFTCTCALRGFIRLGLESEKNRSGVMFLQWPQGYYCSYPEALRDSNLNNIWISEISCNTGLLAATILCPAVVVIIVVLMLCRHFDILWYMGMIWQWTRAKHRARRQQLRPEDLVGIKFHAFVSYSQRDADWVRDHLLPNLEGPAGGLRICHHEKNFVAGRTIINNIMTCVETSRRCVFVLSAHFVKSNWCHYELYFASHQHLARSSDSVVLVLLEPVPQYLIPSKYYQLKSMMARHTYLEWPQDRAKQRLFWANLRAALQADLPHLPVSDIEE